MRYFLGADQGGTKTYVSVCAEDGTIMGAAKGNPSVFYVEDKENLSTLYIKEAVDLALENSGIELSQISAVCGALTGVDWDFEIPIHEQRLRDGLGIDDAIAINDCIGALRAGSNAPNRAVICAGTGLNAAIRAYGGQEIVYGYYVRGCDSGAISLGNFALCAAIEAEAGLAPQTMLTEMVLEHTGYDCMNKLVVDLTINRFSFERKELTIGLLKTAINGDAAALQIINNFAKNVSDYIRVGVEKLEIQDQMIDLVFSGSVFKNVGSIITTRIKEELNKTEVSYNYVDAIYEPVCGAMLTLLDREYNGNIPKDVLDRFDEGCVKHGLLRDK